MTYAPIAHFLQTAGYDVETTASGVWYGVGHGFFVRVPPYETRHPTSDELALLWRRPSLLGLKYSLPPTDAEANGGLYIVRDANYDFPSLQSTQRRKVRRGLEQCEVRPISFERLQQEGLALNRESLARQRRDDPMLSNAQKWARFCHAGTVCDGAHAWGAFVEGELASYAALFVADGVVNILHTMSRAAYLKKHSSPALIFALTQTWMRTPGIRAVSFGPAGLSSWQGLDKFKAHMGFVFEPLTFAVRLRPIASTLLTNRLTRRAVQALTHRYPENDTLRRVQHVLSLAAHAPAPGVPTPYSEQGGSA